MPYIRAQRRPLLTPSADVKPKDAGELNFQITQLMLSYWDSGLQNYQSINDIIGAVESAKAEFQRRIVAPYEDSKIKENGDVY